MLFQISCALSALVIAACAILHREQSTLYAPKLLRAIPYSQMGPQSLTAVGTLDSICSMDRLGQGRANNPSAGDEIRSWSRLNRDYCCATTACCLGPCRADIPSTRGTGTDPDCSNRKNVWNRSFFPIP